MRLMFILSIVLVSMIIITSQSQVAFGGVIGGSDDPDGVAYDNLSKGQINSFISKLQSAADKIDSGKITGAIGSLEASINQINAFINSGKIKYTVGQTL